MRRNMLFVGLFMVTVLALAACADEGSATDAIEQYLNAQVAGDADKLVSSACPAWEANAKTAAASFQSVDAEIDDLSCTEAGSDGDYTLVTCEGTIIIQYRGEDPRNQAVPDLTYRAIKQDGEWKMCGTQD